MLMVLHFFVMVVIFHNINKVKHL